MHAQMRTTGSDWTTVAVTALAAAALAACSSPTGARATSDGPTDIPRGATVVESEPLIQGAHSAIQERRRLVVRDGAAWRALWDEATARLLPRPAPPAVDFGTHMVVVAAMGSRPTGGYSIDIEEVWRADGGLYAAVVETSPDASCFTTQALTAPLVAVRVLRADAVTFVESERTRACE